MSLILKVPIQVLWQWPDSVIDLYLSFLATEPTIEQRIEVGIAQLTAVTFNRSRQQGEEGKSAADYLIAHEPWDTGPASELSTDELRMMGYVSNPANP
ncbi:MAG: hypothetical protein WKF61_04735 [Luteimonas sp.]